MSVNARLGYGYLTDGATASATVTASGYSASNAVVLDRSTSWKGTGTSAQRLMLNTPSAITPTFLGICGGNYSVWGTTVLQRSDDGVTWTNYLTLTGHASRTDTVQDYFEDLTAAPTKSWWCLYWAAPTAAPEVAVFYLGTVAILTDNYSFPVKEMDVYNVDVQSTEGRILQREQVARRLVRWVLTWTVISSTLKETIRTIIQSEGGNLRPFWFVPADETTSNTYGRAYLVGYEPPAFGIDRAFTEIYEVVLPLLEEV